MIIEFSSISLFKNIMKMANNLLDDVSLIVESDSLRLSALERSHVCFIDIKFNKTFFDVYDIDEATTINLNLLELVNILNRATKDDSLELTINNNYLILKLKSTIERTFKIRLLDDDIMDTPQLPNLDYESYLKFDNDEFKNCIKDCALFNSDKIKFKHNEEELNIQCDGLNAEYNGKISLSEYEGGSSSAMYSSQYINLLTELGVVDNEIVFKFTSDSPLLAIVKNEDCFVSLLIAPRLDIGD